MDDSLSQQHLASMLSAPYSDLEIKESLEILDKRFVENTPEFRRQLRIDAQRDVIESNGAIIRDFARVSEQLMQIGSALDAISNVVAEVQTRQDTTAAEAAPVLEEAAQLFAQKEEAHHKETLLNAFLAHFTISEDDVAALTSSAEPVDDDFFRIFRNVKRIHADCQVLLASGNERVGTEIMDEAGRHLNSAFQKLFRWIQRELKTLSLDNPQVNRGIRRALRVLAERPTLFQNCLDFFSEARQTVIQDSFYIALTGSAPGSASVKHDHGAKPIDMFAHDPLRYVGDILAWLHSAAVGEQEALEVLFIAQEGTGKSLMNNLEDGFKSEPWMGDEDGDVGDWDINASLKNLVDKNLETVAKPIRAKIEQAIAGQESSTLSYKINNLINFYRLTFEKLLGTDSRTLDAIKSVEESALRQFNNTMRDHVLSVKAELPETPYDLSPPEFLKQSLRELSLLMKTHSTSLSPAEEREHEFTKVLEQALDPYFEFCETISSGLSPSDNHTFRVNCLSMARETLLPFEFTQERITQFDEQIRYHTEALVQTQYQHFAEVSGLRPLVEALNEWEAPSQTRPPLSQLKPFQLEALQNVSYKLDDFLPSALMDARMTLKKLANSKVLDEVIQRAVAKFIEDFERVEEVVVDVLSNEVEGGMEVIRSVLPRTTEEVRMLLS